MHAGSAWGCIQRVPSGRRGSSQASDDREIIMKRILAAAATALALLAAGAAGAAPASGQSEAAARIHLLHGIPDTPVDVAAGGEDVITDFTFGETEDLSALAGQTLAGLQVKAAGTDDVAIDAGDTELPASGNVTIVAHLDAEETPTLTVFTNDTSAIAAGSGRLVVRHTAAAPAVDVLANGEVAFPGLTNPNEASADLPAGTVSAEVVPAGASEPVVIGPADLPVTEGSTLVVYAVGSLDGGTLQTLTETIEGSQSGPAEVHTGTSPVDDGGSSTPLWLFAAAVAAAVAAVALGPGRRAFRPAAHR
jgi:hypothetical protein